MKILPETTEKLHLQYYVNIVHCRLDLFLQQGRADTK